MQQVRNLTEHTTGERAWLWRLRNNLSQAAMANMVSMSVTSYRRAENDRIEWRSPYQLLPLTNPTTGELCALARRRHGLGLRKTAALMGCTHVTLLAKERRCDPELVTAWRRLGYKLPRK